MVDYAVKIRVKFWSMFPVFRLILPVKSAYLPIILGALVSPPSVFFLGHLKFLHNLTHAQNKIFLCCTMHTFEICYCFDLIQKFCYAFNLENDG
jgi:hypothetical protein